MYSANLWHQYALSSGFLSSFFFFFFERGICLLAPFKLAPRQSYCTAVFEEQLGLSSSPQSPITGTQQSLRCAGRQSDTDSNTCTHTSTYAPFHLLHQPEEAEPLIPNQLRLHFLHLSALFGIHTQIGVYTFAHRNMHTPSPPQRLLQKKKWSATPLPREISFFFLFSFGKLLGVTRTEKVLAFCYFRRISTIVRAKWDLGQRRKIVSIFHVSSTDRKWADRKTTREQSITFLFNFPFCPRTCWLIS